MAQVRITDVAPRDGLQNEPQPVATPLKVELVRRLAAAGLDEVEVTSFVPPQWVPQLSDAVEVFAALRDDPPSATLFSALVPNAKGMETALRVNAAAGRPLIGKVSVFTAASETFSRKNTNASIAQTLERFEPVIQMAHREGLLVRGYLSCAIACPFEGPIAPAAVADVAARLSAIGVNEIDIADTIGAGTSQTVEEMLLAVIGALGAAAIPRLSLHLHDTFGHAVECLTPALRLGVRSFDGAAGGLGGCPYAATPGRRAPGNLDTSALVAAVHAAGFRTGANIEKLQAAGQFALTLRSDGR